MMQKSYQMALDIDRLGSELITHFSAKGYETQSFGNATEMMVQIRKAGILRKATGMDQALTVHMTRLGGATNVSLGQASWGTKAVGEAVGLFLVWPLMLTATYGAYEQAKLPSEIWATIDGYAAATGVNLETTPHTFVQTSHCPHCGVTNSSDSSFCSACGERLRA
jgi:hypothetical protein